MVRLHVGSVVRQGCIIIIRWTEVAMNRRFLLTTVM